MKINRKEITSEFKPFSLEIAIETEDEARALYALFNSNKIIDKISDKYNICFLNEFAQARLAIGFEYEQSSLFL